MIRRKGHTNRFVHDYRVVRQAAVKAEPQAGQLQQALF